MTELNTTKDTQSEICNVSTESKIVLSNSDIQKLQAEYLKAAHSDNTRKAYQAACDHFERWGGLLPTNPETLKRYLIEQANTQKPKTKEFINPRTIEARLCAISKWHKTQKFDNPANDPIIKAVMLGIKRKHGRPKQKAKALRLEDLFTMIMHLQAQPQSLTTLRDIALLLIGYFGAFRRSELVSIKVEQITWEAEGITVKLPRSKTDQTGEGINRYISKGTGKICPITALKQWLDESGIESGTVFRSINRWGDIKDNADNPKKNQLYPGTVSVILKSIGIKCGLDYVKMLSSHSLRSGITTSAAREGVDFKDIKKQGGWRSDSTVWEYIEEGQGHESNASKTLINKMNELV